MCQFLGFTTALCSESAGRSTSKVLMLMLYWSGKKIRNSMHLPPNTRIIHKTNNRLTLVTVIGRHCHWSTDYFSNIVST